MKIINNRHFRFRSTEMWRIFEHGKALNIKALRATCLVRTIFSIDINALRANLKARKTSILNIKKREWNFARRASISIGKNANNKRIVRRTSTK